jgi:hypothetical protein
VSDALDQLHEVMDDMQARAQRVFCHPEQYTALLAALDAHPFGGLVTLYPSAMVDKNTLIIMRDGEGL